MKLPYLDPNDDLVFLVDNPDLSLIPKEMPAMERMLLEKAVKNAAGKHAHLYRGEKGKISWASVFVADLPCGPPTNSCFFLDGNAGVWYESGDVSMNISMAPEVWFREPTADEAARLRKMMFDEDDQ